MHFMMRAKALVAFPGGFGTLDELFEVITLVQTRKAKQVPIVLFGTDYWKRLINFDVLIEEGVISAADLRNSLEHHQGVLSALGSLPRSAGLRRASTPAGCRRRRWRP